MDGGVVLFIDEVTMKRTLIVQTGLMMNARWTRWLSLETAAANCTRPLVRYSQYCLIVLKGSAGSPGFAHNIYHVHTDSCMYAYKTTISFD